MKFSEEEKREIAEDLRELGQTKGWASLMKVKDHVKADLQNGLTQKVSSGGSLYNEPGFDKIIANRLGKVEMLDEFFHLVYKFKDSYKEGS